MLGTIETKAATAFRQRRRTGNTISFNHTMFHATKYLVDPRTNKQLTDPIPSTSPRTQIKKIAVLHLHVQWVVLHELSQANELK